MLGSEPAPMHGAARLTVEDDRISVQCDNPEFAGMVARRLLRSHDVRSVHYNAAQAQATVCLRRPASASKMLGEIALLAGRQSQALHSAAHAVREAEHVITWRDARSGAESYVRAPQQTRGLLRLVLLAGAGLTFLMGAVGVVVPGLPTTPLLLLSSFCLLRSSHRLHRRLIESRTFGSFLRDWHAHRALRRGVKPVAFTTMGLTVGASLWWGGLPIAAKIGVLSCALIGVAVVARLPVINED
ncbi:MAG: DUF454 family protein [Planctomycetales bacterium]|nr:DUF454 family protein [Planctomycetales bacterium]